MSRLKIRIHILKYIFYKKSSIQLCKYKPVYLVSCVRAFHSEPRKDCHSFPLSTKPVCTVSSGKTAELNPALGTTITKLFSQYLYHFSNLQYTVSTSIFTFRSLDTKPEYYLSIVLPLFCKESNTLISP